MVEPILSSLSVSKQCALLSISRSEPPGFCQRLLSSYFKLRFCLISRLVRTLHLLRLA